MTLESSHIKAGNCIEDWHLTPIFKYNFFSSGIFLNQTWEEKKITHKMNLMFFFISIMWNGDGNLDRKFKVSWLKDEKR